MRKSLGLAALLGVLIASDADAHTLKIDCKKTSATDVVCRSLFSDGEVARGMTIQLISEDTDKVLRQAAKTDVEGKYAFKAPATPYSVVVQASKAEVASISSEDIW